MSSFYFVPCIVSKEGGRRMKLPRTPWSKRAVITMIQKEMSTNQVADAAGLTRQYTAAILYGRVDSPEARKKISSVLEISDSDEPSTFTVKV